MYSKCIQKVFMNTGLLKKSLNTIRILVFIIFIILNTHEYMKKRNRIQMNTYTEYEYPMSGPRADRLKNIGMISFQSHLCLPRASSLELISYRVS